MFLSALDRLTLLYVLAASVLLAAHVATGADVTVACVEVPVADAEGQLAHFNLGLAFRQKGYYGEALRELFGLDRDAPAAVGQTPRTMEEDA